MLYNILDFLKIKDKNRFVSVFFILLTLFVLAVCVTNLVTFLFGDGHIGYSIDPILYALAILCPAGAYCYGVNSKLIVGQEKRINYFMITLVCISAILATLLVDYISATVWYALKLLPNFETVYGIPELRPLFAPAIKTICLSVPFCLLFKILDYLLLILTEEDIVEGLTKFCGLKVAKATKENRDFACDNIICKDMKTMTPVVVDEKKRMESTLVQGATGTGKTSMVLLPMGARDIEKKYFIREYSKKMAYTLLKNGVAYIEGPYTNEYINLNFSMNFISPKKGREDEFHNALKDIELYIDPATGKATYRNLGITVVENDGNYVDNFTKVANNFDMQVLNVDPMDPNTMSMNPFAIKNPEKVASIIADVLKSMQQSEGGKEETFFANLTSDAFQNLAILLKEMYPRLHNGDLPSLEDMLEMLYNFDRVEEMTEEMKKVPELAAKYPILISYFEKNFYKPTLNINGFEIPGTRGSGRKDTERFLYGAITQLNNLLRHPGIKKALCGRTNVINFDNALENGNIITACSRKGDLGVIASKAFGMFFILQFQDAVLRRPGSEDSRIPHFLYIDEFPEYINKDMEVMFTLFRKYRCGTTIAIQNLSQLSKHKGLEYYRQVVLANTKTQIVFGDTVPEDSEYWNKAFGMTKKYDVSSTFDKSTGDFKTKKSAAYKDKDRFKVHKISEHGFGAIYFKTKKSNGSTLFGEGKVDFLEAKYKQKHSTYMYDFEKFMLNKPSSGASAYDNKDDTFANNNSSSSNVTYQQAVPNSNQTLINYDIVIDTGNSSPIDHADNFNSNVISFDIDLGNGNKIE